MSMLTHIKTHIRFHLSQRQFRLLLLLLIVSSEYTFLVTPGTFANGVEQILSATGTTVSQTGTVKLSSQVREKNMNYSVASRASSLPAKEQNSISNADGWMTSSDEAPGSWIVFDKKITTQASSNTPNQTPSNALPPSFNAAPSVPTYNPNYNPNYIYPTTPISETAYTIATSYPSGNPGKTVNSTSDVPEGTNLYYTTVRFIADFVARFQSAFDSAFSNKTTDNLAEGTGSLYFTDSRAQNAMSGTVNTLSGNINSLSGRISTVEQNVTANLSGSLTNTNADISTLSGRVNTLSGTVSSNFSTLLTSLATKIGLTSLSATGGISYNSGTGLFSDLFTFSNGLTRIGNSIGISSVTGAQLSGFTSGQLTFGTASGGLTSNNNLFWDNTNGRLGIGTNTPTEKLDVVGNIQSSSNLILTNSGYANVKVSNDSAGLVLDMGALAKFRLVSAANDVWFQNTNSAGNIMFSGNAGANLTGNVIFKTSGNIGIGTSAPGAKLEIDNITANTSGLRFTRLTSTGTSSSLFSGILGVNSTGDIGIAQLTGNSFTGFTNGQLTFGTASGGLSSTGQLFWDNTNGRLGIGTNAPATKFQVTAGPSVVDGLYVRAGADWDAIGFAHDGSIGYINAAGAESGISFRVATGATGNAQTQTYFERMRILANGNVGIGTSAPNTKLEIDNTTANTSGLRFTRLTSTGISSSLFSGILGVNSTGDVGIAQLTGNSFTGFTNGQLAFGTSTGGLSQSSNLFWDNTNGRLGIGTNSPLYTLDLSGSLRVGNGLNGTIYLGDGSFTKNSGSSWFFVSGLGTNGFTTAAQYDATSGSESSASYKASGGSAGIYFPTTSSVGITTGGSGRLLVTSSGNIGIGTTNPNSKLELNSRTGGLSGLRFTQLLSSSTGSTNYSGILGVNSTGDVGITQLTGNSFTGFTTGQLAFGTASGGLTSTGGLFWDNTNGNLGIGTNSPAYKLHVKGVVGIDSTAGFSYNHVSADTFASGLNVYKRGTTGNSSSAITNGSEIGYHGFYGWDGTSYGRAAYVITQATENWTTTGHGSSYAITTTANGTTGNVTRLFIGNNGNVGIGTTSPSYLLHVNGTAAGTSWTNTSDERFKTNISNLTSGLDIIKSLRSVSYNWNALGKAHGGDIDKLQYGFIAQEVENILPAIVNTDNEGYKSIDYIKVIPFLTNALQELAENTASTGALNTLSGQVALLSQNSGSTVVNNNYYSSGTTSSGTTWIESVFSYTSSLLVRVEATFSEMVTFMKSVVFRSTVTFEDRVTFSDKDMAGTATIRAGESSVRIDFSHPYSEIPRVTVTADAFVTYRVTDKMVTGFTIETQTPVPTDTKFDWMAVMVRGLGGTPVSSPSSGASSSSSTTSPSPETSSSGTVTPESNTGTTSPTESGSITPPDTSTTQTTVSGEVTP